MNVEINENWECFLCAADIDFKIIPTGYLSNSHPLCKKCADIILKDVNHKQHFRLTYHNQVGDIKIIADIPVQFGYPKMN